MKRIEKKTQKRQENITNKKNMLINNILLLNDISISKGCLSILTMTKSQDNFYKVFQN